MLSFAGTVTFANAAALREAAAVTPLDAILVETDAPYLTPMPYRGRPNGSYLIPLTVRALAEATGADLAELCAAISANGERMFGPVARRRAGHDAAGHRDRAGTGCSAACPRSSATCRRRCST